MKVLYCTILKLAKIMSAEKRSAPEGELAEGEDIKKPRLDGADSPDDLDSDSEPESEEEAQQLQDPGKKT